MEENKEISFREGAEINSKKINYLKKNIKIFFISLFIIGGVVYFYDRFYLSPSSRSISFFVIKMYLFVFSYFIFYKMYIRKMSYDKKYIINMTCFFAVFASYCATIIIMNYLALFYYLKDFSIFYLTLIFISYLLPFICMVFLFCRKDYMIYTCRYVIYSFLINVSFCYSYLFLSYAFNFEFYRILNMIYFLFWCLFLSFSITSLYSMFFLLFQPLISVSFLFLGKKRFPEETKTNAVRIWWWLLIIYALLPDAYFLLFGRPEDMGNSLVYTFFSFEWLILW